MKTEVIPAAAQDIPVIYALAEKIWFDHYPSIISREQISYMLRNFYSPEALIKDIAQGHRFYLILQEGKTVGYLSESEVTGCDYFLHKFYIDTSLQGKGIGSEVLDIVFNSKPGIRTIRLTVNRMNYKSINFYFRNGFIIENTADFDIGNGFFMNDFIMLRKF
jgi:ribosomal protein S18 acetylase RimI-like enzyme